LRVGVSFIEAELREMVTIYWSYSGGHMRGVAEDVGEKDGTGANKTT
jgi:hypothetical protein